MGGMSLQTTGVDQEVKENMDFIHFSRYTVRVLGCKTMCILM